MTFSWQLNSRMFITMMEKAEMIFIQSSDTESNNSNLLYNTVYIQFIYGDMAMHRRPSPCDMRIDTLCQISTF